MKPEPSRVYTLKITLEESDPPIWRRVEVTDAMTLGALHATIQAAMGWEECHLHVFETEETRYGPFYPGADMYDEDLEDEDKVLLGDLLKEPGQRIAYNYDFGDDWFHTVELESVSDAPVPGKHYPVCLAGERACPPEDSGGMWGYLQKLDIIADPDHEDYYEISQWMGPKFDPKAFNLDKVNKALARL